MKITSKSTADISSIQQNPVGTNVKKIASRMLNMLKKIVPSTDKLNINTHSGRKPKINYSDSISMYKAGTFKKNMDPVIGNSHTSQELGNDSKIFDEFAKDVNLQTYVSVPAFKPSENLNAAEFRYHLDNISMHKKETSEMRTDFSTSAFKPSEIIYEGESRYPFGNISMHKKETSEMRTDFSTSAFKSSEIIYEGESRYPFGNISMHKKETFEMWTDFSTSAFKPSEIICEGESRYPFDNISMHKKGTFEMRTDFSTSAFKPSEIIYEAESRYHTEVQPNEALDIGEKLDENVNIRTHGPEPKKVRFSEIVSTITIDKQLSEEKLKDNS